MNNKKIKVIVLSMILFLLIVVGLTFKPILVNHYIKKGNNYYKNEKYAEAIVEYQMALKYDNENVTVKKSLGYAFYHEGFLQRTITNFNKAKSNYLKSAEVYSDNPELYIELGNIYLNEQNINEAIRNYEKSVKLKPDNIDSYLKLGTLYYEKNNYNIALSNFEQIIKYQPNSPEIYNKIGIIYSKLNKSTKAKEAFKKTINLKNDDFDALSNLGEIVYKEGNIDDSIKFFERAIEINDNYSNGLKVIGNYYFNKKNYKKSLDAYEKLVILKTPEYNIYLNLTKIYFLQKSYEKLEKNLENANSINTAENKRFSTLLFLTKELTEAKSEIKKIESAIKINNGITDLVNDSKVTNLKGYIISLEEESVFGNTYEIALSSWSDYFESYMPSKEHAVLKTVSKNYQSKGTFSLQVIKKGTTSVKIKEEFGNFTEQWDIYQEATQSEINLYKKFANSVSEGKELNKKNKNKVNLLKNKILDIEKRFKILLNDKIK